MTSWDNVTSILSVKPWTCVLSGNNTDLIALTNTVSKGCYLIKCQHTMMRISLTVPLPRLPPDIIRGRAYSDVRTTETKVTGSSKRQNVGEGHTERYYGIISYGNNRAIPR